MSVTQNCSAMKCSADRPMVHNSVQCFRKTLLLVLLLALLVAAQVPAFASGLPDRIAMNSASASALVKLTGSVHPAVHRGTDLGSSDAAMTLDTMMLHILPTAAQQTEINALLTAQQDPESPLYHQWLTQEEYGARFGLSDADVAALSAWLASQGFTVREVAPSRNMITFSGNVGQAESAFHTAIHDIQVDGAVHQANVTDISLPKAFIGTVGYVTGLNGFRPKGHLAKARPEFTSHSSGSHFLSPGDWATIYNVAPVYTAGTTGSGMHVGIVGQTYIPQTDVDNFRSAAGLPATLLTYYCTTSSTGSCSATTDESVDDVAEADIDVEWSGAIAKSATVDYIYTSAASNGNGVYDALTYAITTYRVGGSVVPVISMSYGSCETDLTGSGASYRASMDVYFAQAATQGQTLLNSSGDDGAAECDYTESSAAHGLVASWPATSPNFTGVGGTEFNADGTPANPQTGADAYWTYSSTADIISSAIQYIPETSWNDTAYNQSLKSTNGLSATGGGVSLIYPAQTWQPTPSGFTGTSMRFSPDISFTASPDHDGYLVCTQNFTGTTVASSTGSTCTDGFRYGSATGNLTVYGGTSCSSPSFAGLLTLIVQAGGKLGAVNSKLYALAANSSSYASIFHDVTTGNNIVPCTVGAAGNTINGVNDCTTGSMGYSATTGYDLVTGLGSANGMNLYSALTNALSASSTALQLSGSSVNLNGSINLTATVSSTSSGTPTGTVTFYVGSTSLGTATLNGSDTATLSNVAVTVANGFSAGTDSLTAVYSGDTTFATSTSTAQSLTVIGLTTTTSVSPSSSSVTYGSSVTYTALVSPTAATGTVTFTVGSTTVGTATLSSGTASLAALSNSSNGFGIGSNTVTASYGGDSSYATSSGSTSVSVTQVSTTTTVSAGSSSVNYGSNETLTATVSPSTASGTVTFYNGTTSLGTATLSSGTATLTLAATTANNYAVGSNSITAIYAGSTYYATSTSSSTTVTVVPTYTITSGTASLSAGGSGTANLTLTSLGYAGTVTLVATTSSTAITASASSVTLTSGGTGTSTVAISATTSADNRAPVMPWKTGGALVLAAVLGLPLTLRRKRTLAVLLSALAVILIGFAMSCGSGGSKAARTYTVTLTPTGSGTVSNPSATTVTVTVQ